MFIYLLRLVTHSHSKHQVIRKQFVSSPQSSLEIYEDIHIPQHGAA